MTSLSAFARSYLMSGSSGLQQAQHRPPATHLWDAPYWWRGHIIHGGPGGDILTGGSGNDILLGYGGDDRLEGGGGDDLLIGGDANDWLYGGTGNDVIRGGAGTDEIIGAAGCDDVDGGDGFDTLNYQADGGSGGVFVNVAAGMARDTFGNGDTFRNVEGFEGTMKADTFIGSSQQGSQAFWGFGGSDTFVGNSANSGIYVVYGTDVELGGAAGIYVNLAAGFAIDGFGDRDTLLNIHSIIATNASDRLIGSIWDDNFDPLAGNDYIDGGAGWDTVSYSTSWGALPTDFVVVNLATGVADGSFTGHDTLVGIENVNTGDGDDTIIGNGGVNQLYAGAGKDTLVGGSGDDTILGGDAIDTVTGGEGNDHLDGGADRNTLDYASEGGAGGIIVDLGAGTAIDTFGDHDVISNFDDVRGSMQADAITAAADNDYHMIIGLGGADTIVGKGTGLFVGYDQDWRFGGTGGVLVNLTTGAATDGFGAHDTLLNVHGVYGTRYADTVTGSAGDDTFAMGAGNDVIDGKGGRDYVAYTPDVTWGASPLDSVVVDLAAGTADGTFSGHDTLISIEGVHGTQGADTLRGSSVDNVLEGYEGNDVIEGRGGNDVLVGGAGSDTFVFGSGFGSDTIIDFGVADGDVVAFDHTVLLNFAAVISHAHEDANGVLIDAGAGQSVELLGVHLNQLTSSDFQFV